MVSNKSAGKNRNSSYGMTKALYQRMVGHILEDYIFTYKNANLL